MNKIRCILYSIVVIGLLLFVAGCDESKSVQTFEVCTQETEGTDLRMVWITSTKYYYESKQTEVRAKLENLLNGGEYNVVSVKTSYTEGYLTGAEVIYNPSSICGDGNRLRILFVHNTYFYFSAKQKDVKLNLYEIVNGGEYDIVRIQTIYVKGYLVAAEIYYKLSL